MSKQNLSLVFIAAIFAMQVAVADDPAPANPDSVIDTLMAGKPHIHLRSRYENVDDDLVPAKDANALTLRAALGWESGVYRGFSVYAEMEHVSALVDNYKEGPGLVDPGNAQFPVVADPAGTELNEAYVKYAADDHWGIKIGRQIITYRKAPFHRFLGTVLWRQNWQTHDGISIWAKPIKDLTLNYGYSAQVNRIFGEDAPSPFDDFNCDCHLINGQYDGFAHLKLEAYGYLLDIDNAAANSLNTFGFRGYGAYPFSPKVKLIYAAEYANQNDATNNPRHVNADYYLGEIGFGFKLPNADIPNITIKFDYEALEGNGTTAFQTPLATGHAFQGWADRFLVTPPDGVEDFYITAIASVMGGKLIASYHMLQSDQASYEYGEEFDILYSHKFAKYWTFGAKAAIYNADRNSTALARAGGGQNNDVTKIWAWLQFDY